MLRTPYGLEVGGAILRAPVKKTTALAWELRGALMMRYEVVISVRDGALVQRVRGYVVEVAATDANASIDDARYDEPVLVPLDAVLTIRRPHYHEEGDAPERNRPIFEPRTDAPPMRGQMRLGGRPWKVSRRTTIPMQKATGMLLPQDLLDVLAALDRASKGRQSVPTTAVADRMARYDEDEESIIDAPSSIQWTVRRLNELAELRLAFVVGERPYAWTPGE